MNDPIRIRPATPDDTPLLHDFIRALARYEKLEAEATGTLADLRETLFGSEPFARALLAFHGGEPAGFAVYFFTFSTFRAKPVLYLEDLFVHEHLRGRGIGRRLFDELIHIARSNHCARFEWSVLDWNLPSIAFYEKLGAKPKREWIKFCLDQEQFLSLAHPLSAREIAPENKNRDVPVDPA